MMNMYLFITEILSREGFAFTFNFGYEKPSNGTKSIHIGGFIVRTDGEKLNKGDLEILAANSYIHGVIPVLDSEIAPSKKLGQPENGIKTTFIDLPFYKKFIDNMRGIIEELEEFNAYLQEEEGLVELVSGYQKSLYDFSDVMHMTEHGSLLQETSSLLQNSIRNHKRNVYLFFVHFNDFQEHEKESSIPLLVNKIEETGNLIQRVLPSLIM